MNYYGICRDVESRGFKLEILLAANIFVTGLMIGLCAADFWQRQKIRAQLMAELEATRKLCQTVSESHNGLVEQSKRITDRVAAFEMVMVRK